MYKKYDSKLGELTTSHESNKLRIESLESEIYQIKTKYTPRTEGTWSLTQPKYSRKA